jgi:multidrug resistance efflux pump
MKRCLTISLFVLTAALLLAQQGPGRRRGPATSPVTGPPIAAPQAVTVAITIDGTTQTMALSTVQINAITAAINAARYKDASGNTVVPYADAGAWLIQNTSNRLLAGLVRQFPNSSPDVQTAQQQVTAAQAALDAANATLNQTVNAAANSATKKQ